MKETILTAIGNDETIIKQMTLSKKTMLPEVASMGVGIVVGVIGLLLRNVSLIGILIALIGFLWALYTIKDVLIDCIRFLVMSRSPAFAYTEKNIYLRVTGMTIFNSVTIVIPFADITEIKPVDSTLLKFINYSSMFKFGMIGVSYKDETGEKKVTSFNINHYEEICDELNEYKKKTQENI